MSKQVTIKKDAIDGYNVVSENGRVLENLATYQDCEERILRGVYPGYSLEVTFEWDWEEDANRVVKYLDIQGMTEQEVEEIQNTFECNGLEFAKAKAKALAKLRGAKFRYIPCSRMSLMDYRAAVLRLYREGA